MKGIILDQDIKYMRDVTGNYKAGIFKWSDGNFIQHEDKTTSAVFSDKIALKSNINVILLIYDGKDYKQIKIEKLTKEQKTDFSYMNYKDFLTFIKIYSSMGLLTLSGQLDADKKIAFSDFIKDQKILRLTKENALTRPIDRFKTILDFLHFALIIAALIAIWYMVGQSTNNNAPILKANNQTLNVCQNQMTRCVNFTNRCLTALANVRGINLNTNSTLPSAP